MNISKFLACLCFAFFVGAWIATFQVAEKKMADNEGRRDQFLIDQCLNQRTLSVTFSDGSKTYCLPEINPTNGVLKESKADEKEWI